MEEVNERTRRELIRLAGDIENLKQDKRYLRRDIGPLEEELRKEVKEDESRRSLVHGPQVSLPIKPLTTRIIPRCTIARALRERPPCRLA
jgi:hypothetical protein